MGVNGLWKVLKPYAIKIRKEELINSKVAVDISLWLNKALKGSGDKTKNSFLLYIFRRILKLLVIGMKPIFVFDGKSSKFKRDTRRKRKLIRENKLKNLESKKVDFYAKKLLKVNVEKDKIQTKSEEVPIIYDETNLSNFYNTITDLGKNIDVNSFKFKDLPLNIRHFMVSQKRGEIAKNSVETKYENMENFSEIQLDNIMERAKLTNELIKLENDMKEEYARSVFGLNNNRIIEGRNISSNEKEFVFLMETSKKFEEKIELRNTIQVQKNDSINPMETLQFFKKNIQNENYIDMVMDKVDLSEENDDENLFIKDKINSDDIIKNDKYNVYNDTLERENLEKSEKLEKSINFIKNDPVHLNNDTLEREKFEKSEKSITLINNDPVLVNNDSIETEKSEKFVTLIKNDPVLVNNDSIETDKSEKFVTLLKNDPVLVSNDSIETEKLITLIKNDPVLVNNDLIETEKLITLIKNDPVLVNKDSIEGENVNKSIDFINDEHVTNKNINQYINLLNTKRLQNEIVNIENDLQNPLITENIYKCIELFEILGIPYIFANEEAEAQCAALTISNHCDFVLTSDSDSLLFGSKKVLKDFLTNPNDDSLYEFDLYDLEYIYKNFNIHRNHLISFAMLSGCDYTTGIENFGPVKSMEVITSYIQETDCLQILSLFKSHVNEKTKVSIPDEFPSVSIINAFLNPNVGDYDNFPFEWLEIKEKKLIDFCCGMFDWEPIKSQDIIINFMNEMKKKPIKITKWFPKVKNQDDDNHL